VPGIELFRDVGLLVHGEPAITARKKKLADRESERKS